MLSGGDCKAGRGPGLQRLMGEEQPSQFLGPGMACFGQMLDYVGTGEWISTAQKEKDGVRVQSHEQIPENTEYCAVHVCGSRVERMGLNAGESGRQPGTTVLVVMPLRIADSCTNLMSLGENFCSPNPLEHFMLKHETSGCSLGSDID